jgi:hypothetical protein
VSGDRVFILPTQEGNLTGIIIYHLKTHRAQSFPLPPDLPPYFGCPSFSPDGTKVAYYALAGPHQGQVRVRTWPGWRLISQSPVLPLRATDVPPDAPLWKTETLVEFDAQFFDPPRRFSLALPD